MNSSIPLTVIYVKDRMWFFCFVFSCCTTCKDFADTTSGTQWMCSTKSVDDASPTSFTRLTDVICEFSWPHLTFIWKSSYRSSDELLTRWSWFFRAKIQIRLSLSLETKNMEFTRSASHHPIIQKIRRSFWDCRFLPYQVKNKWKRKAFFRFSHLLHVFNLPENNELIFDATWFSDVPREGQQDTGFHLECHRSILKLKLTKKECVVQSHRLMFQITKSHHRRQFRSIMASSDQVNVGNVSLWSFAFLTIHRSKSFYHPFARTHYVRTSEMMCHRYSNSLIRETHDHVEMSCFHWVETTSLTSAMFLLRNFLDIVLTVLEMSTSHVILWFSQREMSTNHFLHVVFFKGVILNHQSDITPW